MTTELTYELYDHETSYVPTEIHAKMLLHMGVLVIKVSTYSIWHLPIDVIVKMINNM